jgi:hypothetical protein
LRAQPGAGSGVTMLDILSAFGARVALLMGFIAYCWALFNGVSAFGCAALLGWVFLLALNVREWPRVDCYEVLIEYRFTDYMRLKAP